MDKIKNILARLSREEEGQDVIEYGLVAVFISIALAAFVMLFSPPLNALYEKVLTVLQLVTS